jgi:hypothetical protein
MSARRYSFVGLLLFGLASTSCSVNPEKTDKRSLGEGAAVPEVPSGTKKEETDVTDSSQVASENLFLKNIVSDLKLNGLDA